LQVQIPTFAYAGLLAKILLCLSVALLFTHQLIPHDHDEHAEIAAHHPLENNHDHASHNVDHLFNNSFQKLVLKVAVHYIDCTRPSNLETPFIILFFVQTHVTPLTRSAAHSIFTLI